MSTGCTSGRFSHETLLVHWAEVQLSNRATWRWSSFDCVEGEHNQVCTSQTVLNNIAMVVRTSAGKARATVWLIQHGERILSGFELHCTMCSMLVPNHSPARGLYELLWFRTAYGSTLSWTLLRPAPRNLQDHSTISPDTTLAYPFLCARC